MDIDGLWYDFVKSLKKGGILGWSRSTEVGVDVDCVVSILDKCFIV